MPKLIIINEFLENKVGHYYEYDKSVQQTFAAKGFDCAIYGKATMLPQIAAELHAIPYFQYDPKIWYRKIPLIGSTLYRFYYWRQLAAQIRAIIKLETQGKNANKDVQFFFPNIFWYNMIGVANGLQSVAHRTTLLYRISVVEPMEKSKFLQKAIPKIFSFFSKQLAKNNQIVFSSDSQVIAQEFLQEFQLPMRVLPIPHLTDIGVGMKPKDDGALKLYMPGVARLDKGITLITQAMEYLQMHHAQILSSIYLNIQFFGDGQKEIVLPLIERIKATKCQFILLGSLSSEEYVQQFHRTDAILIPYQADQGYKARTSGVLAEAIAACKPFITSKHTWMENQVIDYKVGIAVAETPQALAEAIIDLLQHYKQYAAPMAAAKEKWFAFHSKENFYNVYQAP
jgi:glycosyltransferase involved in cell wall biosynthesis